MRRNEDAVLTEEADPMEQCDDCDGEGCPECDYSGEVQAERNAPMSDYPSDPKRDEAENAYSDREDKVLGGDLWVVHRAFDMEDMMAAWDAGREVGRTEARANPAPQEPPTPGELPEHAQESGWQHDAAEDLYWRGDREEPCGLVEFCDRVGVVTVEGDVQADDLAAILAHRLRAPTEPTEAPKPTSGPSKPRPNMRARGASVKDGGRKDPRNPSPTPEPTTLKERIADRLAWQRARRVQTPTTGVGAIMGMLPDMDEPDPWALPDGWEWYLNALGTWAVRHTLYAGYPRGFDPSALVARRNREDPPTCPNGAATGAAAS